LAELIDAIEFERHHARGLGRVPARVREPAWHLWVTYRKDPYTIYHKTGGLGWEWRWESQNAGTADDSLLDFTTAPNSLLAQPASMANPAARAAAAAAKGTAPVSPAPSLYPEPMPRTEIPGAAREIIRGIRLTSFFRHFSSSQAMAWNRQRKTVVKYLLPYLMLHDWNPGSATLNTNE